MVACNSQGSPSPSRSLDRLPCIIERDTNHRNHDTCNTTSPLKPTAAPSVRTPRTACLTSPPTPTSRAPQPPPSRPPRAAHPQTTRATKSAQPPSAVGRSSTTSPENKNLISEPLKIRKAPTETPWPPGTASHPSQTTRPPQPPPSRPDSAANQSAPTIRATKSPTSSRTRTCSPSGPEKKEVRENNPSSIESPSGTPSWAETRSSPAAGMRESQPPSELESIQPSQNNKESEKEEKSAENPGLASQHQPGGGQEAGQQGRPQHHQGGLGCRGEVRLDVVTEGRCNSVRLARTAATKRGFEDDSETIENETMLAPKKPREEVKNEIGGGQKAPKNKKIEEKLSTIREKIAKYNRQADQLAPEVKNSRTTLEKNKTTTKIQQHLSEKTKTTIPKKTTKGGRHCMEGQQDIAGRLC